MKKLLWLVCLGFVGCIPLVDERLPSILELEDGEVKIRDLYYYNDTLVFKIAFRDNNSLDSVSVNVRPAEQRSLNNRDFVYNERIRVRGRRLERTFRIPIPLTRNFRTVGEYQLRVRVRDRYDNIRDNFWFFDLKADSVAPVFEGLALQLPRSQDPRADYVACRSQVIRVLGRVKDNLLLKRVGVNFSGALNGERQEEIVRAFFDQSISLDTFFKANLSVPARAADGEILTMTFYAYDTAIDNRATAPDPFSGNLRTQTIRVLVNCDDRPPVVSVRSVSPRFVGLNEVALVERGTFRILQATATDDKALLAVYAAFNRDDAELQIVDSLVLGGTVSSVDLVSAGLNLNFTAPPTARVGDVFRVSLFAVDTALNYSEFNTIKVNIVENQNPTIEITDTYVNGFQRSFSTQDIAPLSVASGDIIRFDGKVDDDYRLASVSVLWNGSNVFNSTNPSTPFDLASFQNNSTFVVSSAFGSFSLVIRATDERGLSSLRTYFFIRN
jgi:hypothetical protein